MVGLADAESRADPDRNRPVVQSELLHHMLEMRHDDSDVNTPDRSIDGAPRVQGCVPRLVEAIGRRLARLLRSPD
jgi:hypothetical protein